MILRWVKNTNIHMMFINNVRSIGICGFDPKEGFEIKMAENGFGAGF